MVPEEESSRDVVLRAARHLIARDGFQKVRTKQIAELAGVSDSLLFWLFGSKTGLFQAIVDEHTSSETKCLERADESGSGLVALESYLGSLGRRAQQDPETLRVIGLVMSEISFTEGEIGGAIAVFSITFDETLTRWIADAMEAKEIEAFAEPARVARVLTAAMAGNLNAWIVNAGQDLGAANRDAAEVILRVRRP